MNIAADDDSVIDIRDVSGMDSISYCINSVSRNIDIMRNVLFPLIFILCQSSRLFIQFRFVPSYHSSDPALCPAP